MWNFYNVQFNVKAKWHNWNKIINQVPQEAVGSVLLGQVQQLLAAYPYDVFAQLDWVKAGHFWEGS